MKENDGGIYLCALGFSILFHYGTAVRPAGAGGSRQAKPLFLFERFSGFSYTGYQTSAMGCR
jgi:hypothetical protein